jgi:hypothetical protein
MLGKTKSKGNFGRTIRPFISIQICFLFYKIFRYRFLHFSLKYITETVARTENDHQKRLTIDYLAQYSIRNNE